MTSCTPPMCHATSSSSDTLVVQAFLHHAHRIGNWGRLVEQYLDLDIRRHRTLVVFVSIPSLQCSRVNNVLQLIGDVVFFARRRWQSSLHSLQSSKQSFRYYLLMNMFRLRPYVTVVRNRQAHLVTKFTPLRVDHRTSDHIRSFLPLKRLMPGGIVTLHVI